MRGFHVGAGIAPALLAIASAIVFAGACSDDDAGPGDAGTDVRVVNPPPPSLPPPPAPPPDGVDRTGMLGAMELIADLGEPTDGPSWRASDGALYFTVPGSATPLRRLVPGGAVETAPYDDAGTNAPVGTANGGGARVVLTEKNVLAALDIDDAGVATVTRRAGPANVVLGDVAALEKDGGPSAFFVDTTSPRAFLWDPTIAPPNDLTLVVEMADAGRATGIAAHDVAGVVRVYVAGSGITGYGAAVLVYEQTPGSSDLAEVDAFSLDGTPPNAIAVDQSGHVYVAWARGIDVYRAGQKIGPSPGLPIAAIPTSLAFGGADMRALYVTTATGKIYAVPSNNIGVPR